MALGCKYCMSVQYIIYTIYIEYMVYKYRRKTRKRKQRRFKGGSATDETTCKYVYSRGILKSSDIHSTHPVSSTHDLNGFDLSKVTDDSMF